jgi:hypothetical protein
MTVLAAGLATATLVGSEVMLMSGNSAAQSAAAQLK